jgi:hypothetical protein
VGGPPPGASRLADLARPHEEEHLSVFGEMRLDEMFVKASHALTKTGIYRKMVMTILRYIPRSVKNPAICYYNSSTAFNWTLAILSV